MIYIDDHIWDFDLPQALVTVSEQRRDKALRYRHERDRRLSVAAYRLLQHALEAEFGITRPPFFKIDANGKPTLEAHPDIHFSLSHCDEAVACVVSDRPVGIDIESFSHYSHDVAMATMSKREMAEIGASRQPALTFTRLWTMKESLFKLTGDDAHGTIARMLEQAHRYKFTSLVHGGCLCTTCEKGSESVPQPHKANALLTHA